MLYWDHNATTSVLPEVREAIWPWLGEQFGNASASCLAAKPARRAVAEAREALAALLGAHEQELVFTSGATESINAVLRSAWELQPQARAMVAMETDHSAVREAAKALVAGREGAELIELPVDRQGLLELEVLEEILSKRAGELALVSIHWANNETGVIQPVAEVAASCREAGVALHVDAAQAVGKLAVDVAALGADFVSLSGHKFGAPQGVGALWVKAGMRFAPLLYGGGQEAGRRSGTLNVAGLVGLGKAAEMAQLWLAGEASSKLAALRDEFEAQVKLLWPDLRVHGGGAPRLPNTSNLGFRGLEGEALRVVLDTLGLCCSLGSACRSEAAEASFVLRAMGLGEGEAKSALRFSFGRDLSEAELGQGLSLLEKALKRIEPDGGSVSPIVRRGSV